MYRWCALLLLLTSLPIWGQTGSVTTPSTGTQSIGDAVQTEDKVNHSQPIYVVYVHGINQVGPGDSLLLRKGICKYLGECTVTPLGRIYADSGPFAIDHHPPKITYMEVPVWRTQLEWNASAPFIDRYKIVGHGHAPIIVDEYNWWPIVYPAKCKWLVPNDASLTGPAKNWIDICSGFGSTRSDPDHPGRYLAYSWIDTPGGAQLKRKRASNPPSQAAEPVLKCGYGSSDERSHGKTTDTGRDSADCGGVCNERHATE
jgi:hypothetical protein